LIDHGAQLDSSLIHIIKSYDIERRNTIIFTLLEIIPKVLVNVVVEFM
jgi:hypothetical protein